MPSYIRKVFRVLMFRVLMTLVSSVDFPVLFGPLPPYQIHIHVHIVHQMDDFHRPVLTMLLFFHRDQGNIELVGMSQECHDLGRATATQDLPPSAGKVSGQNGGTE